MKNIKLKVGDFLIPRKDINFIYHKIYYDKDFEYKITNIYKKNYGVVDKFGNIFYWDDGNGELDRYFHSKKIRLKKLESLN